MKHGGRWMGSLGMSVAAIAFMGACGPGGPLPLASPGPSATTGSQPSASVSPGPLVLPLPGLASAPPGTLGEPEVVIRSRELSRELDGWWRIEGRLANVGDLLATQVGLTVGFYDAWGVLVETQEAVLTPDMLEPGQEGRFALTWPPEREVSTLTLQPHWSFVPE